MNSSLQLKYQNVYEDLLNKIKNEEFQPGQKLPTEQELSDFYSVSRVTIRQALKHLEEENFLIRERGKGTFVKKTMREKKIGKIISFSENCIMVGDIPTSKVLFLEKQKSPLIVQHFLDCTDQDVWTIQRIRYANGLEVLYEESYWLDSVCGEISEKIANNSIMKYLSSIGIKFQFIKQEFIALKADKELASYLSVEENFPLLRSTMVFYANNSKPFAVAISYYRTDRMVITATREIDG